MKKQILATVCSALVTVFSVTAVCAEQDPSKPSRNGVIDEGSLEIHSDFRVHVVKHIYGQSPGS